MSWKKHEIDLASSQNQSYVTTDKANDLILSLSRTNNNFKPCGHGSPQYKRLNHHKVPSLLDKCREISVRQGLLRKQIAMRQKVCYFFFKKSCELYIRKFINATSGIKSNMVITIFVGPPTELWPLKGNTYKINNLIKHTW